MNERIRTPRFEAGSVWLVGAGPGDPGLLTLNALSALDRADVVFYDALVASEILELAREGAELICVGKRAGRPSPRQLRINQSLVRAARRGKRVLRLKSGDPFVFGRGGEEALALAAADVPFRVVPGVTAGTAAPAYAGIPLTHRTLARSAVLTTARAAGGGEAELPSRGQGEGDTLVFYMALRRLPSLAERLLRSGRPAHEPVAILQDATTPRARHWYTTLVEARSLVSQLDEEAATLVVVGPAVALAERISPWQQNAPALAETLELRTAEGAMG